MGFDHAPAGAALVGAVVAVVDVVDVIDVPCVVDVVEWSMWSSCRLLRHTPRAANANATRAAAARAASRPVAHYGVNRQAVRLDSAMTRPRIEHDERLGTGHPAAAAQLLDHLPQALDVGNLEPHQGIGVAGRGEHGLHLGELHRRLLDLLEVGRAGEADLGEGLDRTTGLAVIDNDRVTGDHAGPLQTLDAPGHRRGRERDLFADIGHGPACVV